MSIANPCFGRCTLAQATTAIGISSVLRSVVLTMLGFLALQHSSEPRVNVTTSTDNAILTLPVPDSYHLATTFLCDAMIIFFVTFFLFVGVKTKNPNFLLPWLVIHGISAVMTIPRIIYQMTFSNTSLTFLIIRLLFSTLMVYMFIVVSIYFISLRALKDGHVVTENGENANMVPPRSAVPTARRSSASYVHLPPKNYVHCPPPRHESTLSPPPPYEHVV